MSIVRRIFGGFLLMLLLTVGIAVIGWRALSGYADRVDTATAAQALVGEINALALSANRTLAHETGADDIAVAAVLAKVRASIGAIGELAGDDTSIIAARPHGPVGRYLRTGLP